MWIPVRDIYCRFTSDLNFTAAWYLPFRNMFGMRLAETLALHWPLGHAINLLSVCRIFHTAMYNLLEVKLQILEGFMLKNLSTRGIQQVSGSEEAIIAFWMESNCGLHLHINYLVHSSVTFQNEKHPQIILKIIVQTWSILIFAELDLQNMWQHI